MTDFISDNFGFLELLLFLELVVLLTAAIFYKVARIASRNNRYDPMVRFYYVFWQAFRAPVTPVGVIDTNQIRRAGGASGAIAAGNAGPEILTEIDVPQLDAPDLGGLTADDLRARAIVESEADSLATAATPVAGKPSAAGKVSSGASPVPAAADATLEVRIVPRSPADAIAGHAGRTLVIHVRCEAEDGQANAVVVDLASKALDVPVYRIVLLRGHYRTDKAFKILNIDQAALDRRVAAT